MLVTIKAGMRKDENSYVIFYPGDKRNDSLFDAIIILESFRKFFNRSTPDTVPSVNTEAFHWDN